MIHRKCMYDFVYVLGVKIRRNKESKGIVVLSNRTQEKNFSEEQIIYFSFLEYHSSKLLLAFASTAVLGFGIVLALHIEYLIQHGSYRKHRVPQFLHCCVFIASENCLPSRCLAITASSASTLQTC
jgi:hypothetical protein